MPLYSWRVVEAARTSPVLYLSTAAGRRVGSFCFSSAGLVASLRAVFASNYRKCLAKMAIEAAVFASAVVLGLLSGTTLGGS